MSINLKKKARECKTIGTWEPRSKLHKLLGIVLQIALNSIVNDVKESGDFNRSFLEALFN